MSDLTKEQGTAASGDRFVWPTRALYQAPAKALSTQGLFPIAGVHVWGRRVILSTAILGLSCGVILIWCQPTDLSTQRDVLAAPDSTVAIAESPPVRRRSAEALGSDNPVRVPVRNEEDAIGTVANFSADGTRVPRACLSILERDTTESVSEYATPWEAALVSGGPIVVNTIDQIGLAKTIRAFGLSRAFAESAGTIDPILGLAAIRITTGDEQPTERDQAVLRARMAAWHERAPDGLGSQMALVLSQGRPENPPNLHAIAPKLTHRLVQEQFIRQHLHRGSHTQVIELLPITDPALAACRDALFAASPLP